ATPPTGCAFPASARAGAPRKGKLRICGPPRPPVVDHPLPPRPVGAPRTDTQTILVPAASALYTLVCVNRQLRGRRAGRVQWGNCVVQGLWLWMHRTRHVGYPILRRRRGSLFPHFLLVTDRGRVWHFMRIGRENWRFFPIWQGRFHCFPARCLTDFVQTRWRS